MKTLRQLVLVMGVAVVFVVVGARMASAGQLATEGTVLFVGTSAEEWDGYAYHARLRVQIRGVCGTDTVAKERWIAIRSGRMDAGFEHNGVNMKNAFNTLTAALLTGKTVLVWGLANCNPTTFMDLWSGTVGMAR